MQPESTSMTSKEQNYRITPVQLLVYAVISIIAIGSSHFIAQLVCLCLIAALIVLWICHLHRTGLDILILSGFVFVLILLCLPIDLAIRDGARWDIQVADVQYGPDRIEHVATLEKRRIIAYRGIAAFIDVRWALLITVPSDRIIYTPLFVHPRAPFLIGEERTENETME